MGRMMAELGQGLHVGGIDCGAARAPHGCSVPFRDDLERDVPPVTGRMRAGQDCGWGLGRGYLYGAARAPCCCGRGCQVERAGDDGRAFSD
nr:hypothetical protein fge_12_PS366H01_c1_54737 [Paspalum simplex]